MTNVDQAAELISSIAAASAEQAQGIEQVNLGIAQVSQVIQTNAATAQESASASEQLSSQAAQLKEQVGTFKLKVKAAAAPVDTSRKTPALPGKNAAKAPPKISLAAGELGKY